MKLSYGTQISPFPIPLSVGVLRKPKLRDIANPQGEFKMSFEKFNFYEFLITMTPEDFFTKVDLDEGKEFWNSLSDKEKQEITIYDLISGNANLINYFLEVFNFFFEETVLYVDGIFILVNSDIDYENEPPQKEDIIGVIDSNNFAEILYIIQQICCIAPEEKEAPKFKNKIAERIYYQIQEAEQKRKKKADKNLTLPNIISSVSTEHNSLNYTNIWDLTIFQLLDNFGRMREKTILEIEETRVAVWGDEKNAFDPARWYRNDFDKNEP